MESLLLLAFVIGIIVLDFAATHWGFNSSDGIDSSEWEHRQYWYGFH